MSTTKLSYDNFAFHATSAETRIIYTSDFNSVTRGLEGWGANGATAYIATVGGFMPDMLRVICTDSSLAHDAYRQYVFTVGKKYRIKGRFRVSERTSFSNQHIQGISIYAGSTIANYHLSKAGYISMELAEWVGFEHEFIADHENIYFYPLNINGDSTFATVPSDEYQLDDIVISEITDGFPTPYVSRDQQMISVGKRWTQQTNIDINGQITGYDFDNLVDKQDALISGFARDFKSLDLQETGADGAYYSLDGFPLTNCKINNINFEANKYTQLLDYQISIAAYENDLFSGTLGVLDPSEEINFSEQINERIQITHTISAKGISTSSRNAIDNAKHFVLGLTGIREGNKAKITPHLMKYENFNPVLLNTSESINRMDGTYSVTESYGMMKTGQADLVSGLSFSINSGQGDEFGQVELSMDYQGGRTGTIEETRGMIPSFSASGYHQIAESVSNFTLNPYPTSFNVDEDTHSNKITVTATFDSNTLGEYATGVNFDYSIDFVTDEMSNATKVSVKAQISSRGNQPQKPKNAENFLKERIVDLDNSIADCSNEGDYQCFLWNLAKEEYDLHLSNSSYSLNSYPSSSSISKDELNGTINLSASFSDEFSNSSLKSSDFSISVVPGLLSYTAETDIVHPRKVIIYNSQVTKRSSLSINSSVTSKSRSSSDIDAAEVSLDSFISNVYNNFINVREDIILQESNKNSKNQIGSISKQKKYTFHGPRILDIPNPPKP